MNDKSLDVLKQYNLEVHQTTRGRGGMLLSTDRGVKLIMECEKADKCYEKEDAITQAMSLNGFGIVDTFIRNNQGELISAAQDGKKYIVKDWFVGRECNVKALDEVCEAVQTLGKLHNNFNQLSKKNKVPDLGHGTVFIAETGADDEETCKVTPIKEIYIRHMKELKLAGNYLRNKKNKSEFEQIANKKINQFYEEAASAIEQMGREDVTRRLEQAKKDKEICHGNYNYHNVIVFEGGMAVTNFDKYKNECQMYDLYQFMRKIMEKYDWNIEMGYKMLDEYDKVKSLSDTDLEIINVLFSFPEKFWKVINFYFNSSKSWIPRKSIEKLRTVVEQNEKRLNFLQTIS